MLHSFSMYARRSTVLRGLGGVVQRVMSVNSGPLWNAFFTNRVNPFAGVIYSLRVINESCIRELTRRLDPFIDRILLEPNGIQIDSRYLPGSHRVFRLARLLAVEHTRSHEECVVRSDVESLQPVPLQEGELV